MTRFPRPYRTKGQVVYENDILPQGRLIEIWISMAHLNGLICKLLQRFSYKNGKDFHLFII